MTVKRTNPDWEKKLKKAFRDKMPTAATKAMLMVESEAKRIVYLGHEEGHLIRRSGNLSRSITTESFVDESDGLHVGATTGTNMIYAPTHEFGDTRLAWGKVAVHIPPRPFLGPALQSQKAQVKAVIRDEVDKIIKGVTK